MQKTLTILFLLLLSITINAQIYIANSTDLANTTFTANNTYLFQRGVTYNINYILIENEENMTFSDYGDTTLSRPKIIFSTTGNAWKLNNCHGYIIENLHLVGNAEADRIFESYSNNAIIRNCITENAGMGLRGHGTDMKILNNVFHDMRRDGLYLTYLINNIEIGGNHFYNINTEYFNNAPNTGYGEATGDCIQFENVDCTGARIYGNIMDRSNTGHKFNLIINGYKDGIPSTDIIIENNIFYGPKVTNEQPGASLYLAATDMIIRNNEIYDSPTAYDHRSKDVFFYKNLIKNAKTGVMAGKGKPFVENNTFINVDYVAGMWPDDVGGSFLNNLVIWDNSSQRTGMIYDRIDIRNNAYNLIPDDNGSKIVINDAPNSIVTSALGVDQSYVPVTGSPLIDAGYTSPRTTTFEGLAPDVGAYEFGDTSSTVPSPAPTQGWVYPQLDTLTYDVPEATDPVYKNIVYIDPSGANGNGTIGSPYNNWASALPLQDSVAYLQKRGTTSPEVALNISAVNVLIGAYGTGNRPYIDVDQTQTFRFSGDRSVMRDVKVDAGIELGSYNNSKEYMWIYNNEITGLDIDDIGVINWSSHNKIIANHIHNVKSDGIFCQDVDQGGVGTYIAYNYIHDVNTNYFNDQSQSSSPGDVIQISSGDSVHIHHNILDHRTTGNKFCLIIRDESQYYGNVTPMNAIIEYNTMYLSKPGDDGVNAIYLQELQNTIVRYNHIVAKEIDDNNGGVVVRTTGTNVEIYGNVIDNVVQDINTTVPVEVYNNTMVNIQNADMTYWTNVYNNILSGTYQSGVSASNIFINDEGITNIFVDPSGEDYRLKDGSPAINVGTDMGLSYDIVGTSIPQGSAPDAGAYEYPIDPAAFCENNPIQLNLTAEPDTNNLNTGKIYSSVIGGMYPLTYTWNTGATTEDLNGVSSGDYTLTVVDDSTCTAVAGIVIPAVDTSTYTPIYTDSLKIAIGGPDVPGWNVINSVGTYYIGDYIVTLSGMEDYNQFGVILAEYPSSVTDFSGWSSDSIRLSITGITSDTIDIEYYQSRKEVTNRTVTRRIDDVVYPNFDVGGNDQVTVVEGFYVGADDNITFTTKENNSDNWTYLGFFIIRERVDLVADDEPSDPEPPGLLKYRPIKIGGNAVYNIIQYQ